MVKEIEGFDPMIEVCSNSDSGKNIVSLNPRLRLGITASKIAIKIHPRASKRDVLDFVAKRWPWIESQLRTMSTDKALRTRKRKHSQKLLDFMWQNRSYTAKEIKRRLNKSFPNNGLAYHEISKIIDYEGKKRFGELT
jgi:predicted metal-dependent hydrolase